ncbi:MAG: response regulator [Desulfobacteraceae bacterium]|jgi:PAS domain S-box-containing protein
MGEPRLYNSRIIKVYVDYLSRFYPDVNMDRVLERAGMTRYEVEDPAHWFTQDHVDRFHDAVTQATGNPAISREAGRYSVVSSSMSPIKRYALGFLTPSAVSLLMGKVASLVTRATRFEVRKQGSGRIAFTASQLPGAREKPYQCEYRLGSLEAIGLSFSETPAQVDHPECMHRGGKVCRYLVRIPRLPFMPWKHARNAFAGVALVALPPAFFAWPLERWIPLALASTLAFTLIALRTAVLEKWNLARVLREKGDAAREQIDEMKVRADHALLVQEIGQAATSSAQEDVRIGKILGALEKRLDFDCGVLLLAEEGETCLTFSGGFGIPRALETRLQSPCLDLLPLVRERAPILVGSRAQADERIPENLAEIVRELGVREGICAPLFYESRPLGLLLAFHTKVKRPLTQTDISLLEGTASHTAVSIANARAYLRLEVSERNYRELVQASNSVILRTDPTGRITFVNRFAQDLFEGDESHLLGRNVTDTILSQTKQASRKLNRLVHRLRNEASSSHLATESSFVRSDGDEIRITWTHRPLFNENGGLSEILSIGNNITELHAAREEKARLTARLQRSRRMEAVGALSGGVAHELNNILSGIVSYPELLLMDLPLDSPLRKPVETIQKAGEKSAGIVQDMLLLSRKGVTSTEVMSLNHLVHMYMDGGDHRTLAAITPQVHVELSLEKDIPGIQGSVEHLSRTLHCLVTNGYQAMPEGGVLRIATEDVSLDSDYQGYEAVPKGDYVVLRVSDKGPALGEDHLERLFEPFFTKKVLKRPGAGLGLPVVWGIVKDHQGYVDVQSRPGESTTFSLYLPAAARDEEVSGLSTEEKGDIQGRGETVLVVDDVAEQRIIATQILQRLGYEVVSLESGEAALAFLRNHSVDLLVLDMVIEPGMDGLETYRRALIMHPRQRAIIASGYSETERVREALRLGAGAYLKKPYNVKNLGRAVRDELDCRDNGKRYANS